MKYEKRCYFCHGGPVVETKIDHHRHINGHLVEIKGVPCSVCQQCGEKYFDVKTIRRLEKIAERKAKEYIRVPVYSYA